MAQTAGNLKGHNMEPTISEVFDLVLAGAQLTLVVGGPDGDLALFVGKDGWQERVPISYFLDLKPRIIQVQVIRCAGYIEAVYQLLQ